MPSIRRFPAPLRDRGDMAARDKWADWTVTFLILELPIGPVKDRESAEEYWARFGPELTEEWAAEHPGTRPPAWWEWSAPEPIGKDESQTEYLERNGLLAADELRILAG